MNKKLPLKLRRKEELKEIILKCINGEITEEELNNKELYDYSSITDLSELFYNDETIEFIPYFDTSNVLNMNYMFFGCKKLQTIPKYNTNNVQQMKYIFSFCSNLLEIPNISLKELKNDGSISMFLNCSNLKLIYIEDFPEICGNDMFRECYSLNFKKLKGKINNRIFISEYSSYFYRKLKDKRKLLDYFGIFKNECNFKKKVLKRDEELLLKYMEENFIYEDYPF